MFRTLKMYFGNRRTRTRNFCISIGLFFCIIYIIRVNHTGLYIVKYPGDQQNRNFDEYLMKYENNYWTKTDTKKILFWTPFFNSWVWLDDAVKALKTCPVSCSVTNDRATLEDSDAVLFHANDLWKHKGFFATIHNVDVEMPYTRSPNQIWAVLSWEPLMYMWGTIKPHVFNWTIMYRRESTIYNPFTSYYKMSDEELNQQPKAKETTNYFKQKSKFATTLVSNCKDQARRYRIIKELQKYIDLDYFGYCSGNINCPAGVPASECGHKHLKHYKFYLAFENSYCRDYVSEKFWNAVDRRQIPVIAATKYNTELLPPKSYLNVFDFPNIKALAEQMIEIGQNETLFNSYFDWMQSYKVDSTSSYCRMCKELHANRPAQSYADMEGWLQDDVCYKSTPWSLVSEFLDRLMFDLGF
ncbi:alpha-(1,3)-fucosyltransferase fut-6-like [Dreissena polymorpha]|nr:alpha-(1,3)-fucosyltransferase fut-6-like [Dreissena polymorpha]XP_052264931.1 alpha-(1,3)-fucosyltransferase fut-6-like [Dreissena polymorpha]XP_052264932.1 alpha-(1,3)-fucosyltransferase fut-6-like [Dreissena polymorpha]